ncbi:ribose-5-phosphate isomerase RpiA [Fervidicoccus fontis]|uniref:Ribose 5-phosphate isomerase A n=2 Tax=Fervidicoccus fontis TaxID=683846 RepID=I0A1J3_FERFK|nr:ribose-5-phosphate isomerase RpiA [Fervidicoccus fontis]AFH42850.1 ribose-5-phosphate isomerase [Fervidicoccus fontis Kam940]MBE9391635.1 ribose-5-phosphate isomerase RpiA [Fervidicoccus fontis]
MQKEEEKKIAASIATNLEEVKKAKVIGIGTGSTTSYFIDYLPEDILKGKVFVTSSFDSTLRLKQKGAKVLSIDSIESIDIYIDGVDAIDDNGTAIKGGGAALFREKLLASMSKYFVAIADTSKLKKELNNSFIPIEVKPEAVNYVIKKLKDIGVIGNVRYSKEGKWGPVISDSYGVIVDIQIKNWKISLEELNNTLKSITGVVETGLFIGMIDALIVGGEPPIVKQFYRKGKN